MTMARGGAPTVGVAKSFTNTAPLRVGGSIERTGGMFRTANPFGKEMRVLVKAPAGEARQKSHLRVSRSRHPGQLMQHRERPTFTKARREKGPMVLPVFTPSAEHISRDRRVPESRKNFSALKVVTKGEPKITDTQKLQQVRQELQKLSTVALPKISLQTEIRHTLPPVAKPERNVKLQPSLAMAKSATEIQRVLDKSSAKPNVLHMFQKRLQTKISLAQRGPRTDLGKPTVTERVSGQNRMETSALIMLEEYADLLKRLEEKKGASFTQGKAQILSMVEFIALAKDTLEPNQTISVKTNPNVNTDSRNDTALKRSYKEDVLPTGRQKDKDEEPVFEEDPNADAAREQLASRAAEDALNRTENTPISGYDIAGRMPRLILPIEVQSEIVQKLRVAGDGSYHEVVDKIATSGTIYTIHDARIVAKQAIAEAPAVRVRERPTTRPVTQEDVDRVFSQANVLRIVGNTTRSSV